VPHKLHTAQNSKWHIFSKTHPETELNLKFRQERKRIISTKNSKIKKHHLYNFHLLHYLKYSNWQCGRGGNKEDKWNQRVCEASAEYTRYVTCGSVSQ
jgi:hypothetical protein